LRSQHTTLSNLQSPSRRLDDEPHPAPEVSEHIDQHVGAEKINPATEQVAHTRLRDSENLGRFCLFQTTGADDVLDMNHEVGANLEVFGLLGEKPRSRKTLPLDRVTLTFMADLPPLGLSRPALPDHCTQALPGQIQVTT